MGTNKHLSLNRFGLMLKFKFLYPVIKAFAWLLLNDKDRFIYLRFISWVWVQHRDKFYFSLYRAITAYHFIRYTVDVVVPQLTLLEAELQAGIGPVLKK